VLKSLLKKIVPKQLFSAYYYRLAMGSAMYYGRPSEKMIVIGVTGTKGKTSTANFIWAGLSKKYKVGMITSANIRIGDHEELNAYHMTMPGRATIQRLMKKMVQAGCQYCVIETTSEGIKQFRHKGIHYDTLVFTNLTPEHLPSHGGSFENYKQAKGTIFRELSQRPKKVIDGKEISTTVIVNADSEHKDYFLSFPADNKLTYSIVNPSDFQVKGSIHTPLGPQFTLGDASYHLSILGTFNIYNALPAIIIAEKAGLSPADIQAGLERLTLIPGRMEQIQEGQDFTVIVDYAHEKESMGALLATAKSMRQGSAKIIVLLGAEGGGRDKAKRPAMGQIVGKEADYVIVSDVDPYEDDPKQIAEDIAVVAERFGKVREENLFTILDRKEGIAKAISLAKAGDIVLITGKGAEQSMYTNAGKISWDDREVVRGLLKSR
jgi:UDP-N-acetylmuramoyl-L-alanyl-D-glutamate--2,6-diaminopimelate ligase